jgi:hypothetical protein
MPLLPRQPGGQSTGANSYAKAYGTVVLLALVVLILLRQVFGSIKIEAGAR